MGAPIRASASSGIQRGALQLLEASERTHSAEQAHKGSLSCAFRPPRVPGRLFCASKMDAAQARMGRGGCCALDVGQMRRADLVARPQHRVLIRRRQEALACLARLAPVCRRRRAARLSSFRSWVRRGAPFCAAACFRHQMRCAQAVRGICLHSRCRAGSLHLACGESGAPSDANGWTWKTSQELHGGAGSSG